MSRHNSNRRRPRAGRRARAAARPAGALLAALLAGLLLAACGGGAKSTSSASSTSATSAASTSPAGSRGQFGARATALRTCLKQNGVTLPERKPGQPNGERPRGPFGLGAGGGLRLPKGVSHAQLQAALAKCGGVVRRFGAGRNPQRLATFAACMRKNGVNLPAPNTSGKGPVFNTSRIDTTSAAFKKADAQCMRDLLPPGSPAARPGAEAPAG